jgi:hypothetical protein
MYHRGEGGSLCNAVALSVLCAQTDLRNRVKRCLNKNVDGLSLYKVARGDLGSPAAGEINMQ